VGFGPERVRSRSVTRKGPRLGRWLVTVKLASVGVAREDWCFVAHHPPPAMGVDWAEALGIYVAPTEEKNLQLRWPFTGLPVALPSPLAWNRAAEWRHLCIGGGG